MRRAAAALVLLALAATGAPAQNANNIAQELTLALPHPLGAGETAFLEVQLGQIGKGHVVTITTAAGQPLGTFSPFGSRPGQGAGTYTLPVPADAIRDGRLAIRLTISQPAGPPRAPTAQEVHGVTLGIGGARQ